MITPPFGHWQTQTFIAALRHDRLDAPWVISGAMNRAFFDLYVETQLAPTLHEGDVVILDNLATHRSPKAAAILKDIGAWFLFLPPYSPDLNPPYGDCMKWPTGQRIEMAFAKPKALIRKAAARTCDQLWQAVGHVCDLFKEKECYNFFKAAGYETNQTHPACLMTIPAFVRERRHRPAPHTCRAVAVVGSSTAWSDWDRFRVGSIARQWFACKP